MADVPDSFQATLNLTPSPRGVFVSLCDTGEVPESERLLRSFRTVANPMRDTVKRQPFADLAGTPTGTLVKSAAFQHIQAVTREQFSDDVIEIALDQLARSPAAGVIGISHYMHGQVGRVSAEATAFSLRQPGTVHIRIGTTWEDPASGVPLMRWAEDARNLLRSRSRERIFSNYQTLEGAGAAQALFGNNHPRLIALKNKYDPTNFFRRNSNIVPTAI